MASIAAFGEFIGLVVSATISIEGDSPQIHKVYGVLDQMQKKVMSALSTEGFLSKINRKKIKDRLNYRKETAVGSIHFAAAILDPNNQESALSGEETIDGVEFIYNVAADMHIVENEFMAKVASYQSRDSLYGKTLLWQVLSHTTPLLW